MFFYEAIAWEAGLWDDDAMWTPSHMELVLEWCENCKLVNNMGNYVKGARWYSTWKVWKERVSKHCSLMLMVMLYCGLYLGWLPLDDYLLALAMGALAPLSQDTDPAALRSAAAAARVVEDLRKSSTCPDHMVCIILANRLGLKAMRAMSMFVEVCRLRHGKAMQYAQRPSQTRDFRISNALGEWQFELSELAEQTVLEQSLKDAGFIPPNRARSASRAEMDEDSRHAGTAHVFLLHLLASRAIFTSQLSLMFPWAAAALLTTGDMLENVLHRFKDWNKCLECLEAECMDDPEARAFRLRLCFPLWGWVIELFVILKECNFKFVPLDLIARLEKWVRGWLSTKVDEDGNRYLRMKSRGSDHGALGRKERWHELYTSKLVSQYGRSNIQITAEDRADATGSVVDDDFFHANYDYHSLSHDDFDSITTHKPSRPYPHMTPEHFHACGLRWAAYCGVDSFAELQEGWRSLLPPIGVALFCSRGESRDLLGIVLDATEYYVLL